MNDALLLPTLADIESLARQAGEILRNGYEQAHEVRYKGKIDLVTEIDHQSEDFILGEIKKKFPGHQVVSEEAGLVPGAVEQQWYIDPLDGTVNYAHGVPFFSVSIAFALSGKVILGAVYDPLRDELFSACRGTGAHLNGRKLQASAATELEKCLLVTGFPYDTWSSPRNNLENFSKVSRLTQGVRRSGFCCPGPVLRGRRAIGWLLGIDSQPVGRGSGRAGGGGSRGIGDCHGWQRELPLSALFVAGSPTGDIFTTVEITAGRARFPGDIIFLL